ncbi:MULTISPECIES: 2-C-methyl-D-erythritol 4-phosphate cytidylyltransferase [unclassified Saccharopolyspora]|uniref:2-C-methyl-D-erythritol 4-phosphate cytidylyltransferase n=2 Tax=Pseudonocardiaceae TaxID=2070 RepID=UPI00190DE8AB|nr:2-C-methyl-D-erythritol 4-phosphate cytidylyltransferase [Saccharopolyspora sp. HNM0986]MBK0865634.1 2-C-methyl-D-erythritol 4-phosphate cytidylyltransferase [Saccharopolyspora sp. HNM0986]
MKVVALVPAAGRGVRLGAGTPKALVPVSGESLLVRAVRGLLESGSVHHVVVAAPPDQVDVVQRELAVLGAVASWRPDSGFGANVPESPAEVSDPASPVGVVAGGADRTESVRLALAAAERAVPDVRAVLVHDAARAFTPVPVIREVADAVRGGASAVVPVLPVSDTIKQVDADEVVSATVDRSRLRSVQTPQGFEIDVLRAAYAAADDSATDDAGLVERIGGVVRTVAGHPHALKITTAFDLAIAESVLAAEPIGDPR